MPEADFDQSLDNSLGPLPGSAVGAPENPQAPAAAPRVPSHLPFLTPPVPLVHIPPAASGSRRAVRLPIRIATFL